MRYLEPNNSCSGHIINDIIDNMYAYVETNNLVISMFTRPN